MSPGAVQAPHLLLSALQFLGANLARGIIKVPACSGASVLHRLISHLGPALYGAVLLVGVALGVPLGIAAEASYPGFFRNAVAPAPPPPEQSATNVSQRPSLDLFWEAWKTLNDEFINRSALTERNLTYG